MNLICPHCQKQVTIADELSGQTTACPLCRGPFTVPAAAAPPALPPSPPPAAATFAIREEPAASSPPGPRVFDSLPPPPLPVVPPSAGGYVAPPPLEPPITGDYTRRTALYLSPQVIHWIAPVCFLLIFLLMFFPWTGIYGGGAWLVRQSGAQLSFGGYSEHQLDAFKNMWEGKGDGIVSMRDADDKSDTKPPSLWAPLVMIYFFLICIAAAAAIAYLILPYTKLPMAQKLRPWRSMVFGGLSILTLLFLVIQLLFGFPLPNALSARLDKTYDREVKQIKERYTKEIELPNVDAKGKNEAADRRDRGLTNAEFFVGLFRASLANRFWLRITLLLNLAAVIGSLLEWYLARRAMKPLPRFVFER